MGTIGNTVKLGSSTRINMGDALNTLEDRIKGPSNIFTTAGSSTAFTLDTTSIFAPALTDGAMVRARIHATNSAINPTLSVNGTGAKNIQSINLGNLRQGNLRINIIYEFVYYAATDVWVCLNPTFFWSNYTDNGGAALVISSAMTTSIVSVQLAKYSYDPILKRLEVRVQFDVSLSGTPDPVVVFTLPTGITIDASDPQFVVAGGGTVFTGTKDLSCHMEANGSQRDVLRIMKADASNYGISSHNFKVTGVVQTA